MHKYARSGCGFFSRWFESISSIWKLNSILWQDFWPLKCKQRIKEEKKSQTSSMVFE